MCGIALIVSGVLIETGFDICNECVAAAAPDDDEQTGPTKPEDFKAALQRRGPDNFGEQRISFPPEQPVSGEESGNLEDENGLDGPCEHDLCGRTVRFGGFGASGAKPAASIVLLGATLQLRGTNPVSQPLVDSIGNLLAFNGEIFGGIHVAGDSNDAETLLHALERCCSCKCNKNGEFCFCDGGGRTVPEILSTIRGPWSLIYWQERTKTIWFGRDSFGRRSLLVHWPSPGDLQFILSSVSLPSGYWEELPCGIYSIQISTSRNNGPTFHAHLRGELKKHEWADPQIDVLIRWERQFIDPKSEEVLLDCSLTRQQYVPTASCPESMACTLHNVGNEITKHMSLPGCARSACRVLFALRESVRRRSVLDTSYKTIIHGNNAQAAPIAVLFSGGLDSMILAALLDQCIDSKYTIDLLNVSFDGQEAPDRVSACTGLKELQRISPNRSWRLVEIDANLSNLSWETKHVMSLIRPANTYMDLNIGIALWLVAGGDGWVWENHRRCQEDLHRYKYKSTARILLVGSGADEQCAGYGRHRTKYRLGGWAALHEEMRLDMRRIWKRNLGRDDRCISDQGKEARFPFLDEDVIETLLHIPLWEICNLEEPVGQGDKKILREVARLLGLEAAAGMPKRAIQFGSRIARESNRKNFGSNRAANLASAGSVEIGEHR